MPIRKIKAKKYNGIYEYYSAKDNDKVATAYYISYRDELGKAKNHKGTSKNTLLISQKHI